MTPKKPEEMTVIELKALLFDLNNDLQYVSEILKKKLSKVTPPKEEETNNV